MMGDAFTWQIVKEGDVKEVETFYGFSSSLTQLKQDISRLLRCRQQQNSQVKNDTDISLPSYL